MYYPEAFARLGISITKDTAAIKKAYQKLLPQHHPEVDPQGFMELHQAYKTALTYAQGTNRVIISSREVHWQPEFSHSTEEETGYDSLFADLNREQVEDLSQKKKDFSRKLLELKLHWLPIPLKIWHRFFSSEAFRLCQGDSECLERLFALLVNKIHSYGVFRFLLDQLWELIGKLKSEEKEVLANATQKCIAELCEQYSHYLKLDPSSQTARKICSVLWYYEALPFYFKLIASAFLLPLLSFGSGMAWLVWMIIFYAVEFVIWIHKLSKKVGIFRPTLRKGIFGVSFKSTADNPIFIFVTIFAIIFQVGCSIAIMEPLMLILS